MNKCTSKTSHGSGGQGVSLEVLGNSVKVLKGVASVHPLDGAKRPEEGYVTEGAAVDIGVHLDVHQFSGLIGRRFVVDLDVVSVASGLHVVGSAQDHSDRFVVLLGGHRRHQSRLESLFAAEAAANALALDGHAVARDLQNTGNLALNSSQVLYNKIYV